MKKEEIKEGGRYKSLNTGGIYTVTKIVQDYIHYKMGEDSFNNTANADWFCEKFEPYIGNVEKIESPNKNALDTQIGGNHYKNMNIQPIEYIYANELDFFQGNIIKYATRHKNKNGAEDIKKIKHYCDLILKYQYNEK